MPLLAKYHLNDGLIRGVWTATTVEMLQVQVVQDDAEFGYLILADQDTQVLQEHYLVQGGALTAKPQVTLAASPNPFAADGTTVCAISVTPFLPCTVLVNLIPYALAPEDQTILLTSETPTRFDVSLPHQAACWGAPVIVEAVMPRIDHRVTVETVFSYQERMMLTILVEQLNILRAHVGLPPLTPQELRQEARAYVRAHPRQEGSA